MREAGVGGRLLLMTGYWRGEEDAVVAHRLTPAVWTLDHVERLERASAGAAHRRKARRSSQG